MLKSWLGNLFKSSDTVGPIAPDGPFCVIGDVHGRIDLLDRMLDRIGTERSVVCVGDYVDRGEHSSEVLVRLQDRPDTTCLKGNHEEMLLKFLEDPISAGPRWLRYGGLQTLASFGVSGVTDTSRGDDLTAARDRLQQAMGDQMCEWLNDLPLWYRSGNVAVVHAGADPHCSIEHQDNASLLWGHPDFLKSGRPDGLWVVHGHTIVDEPSSKNGRIAIDTGAYATGRLTAAMISPGSVEFVTV